MLGAQSVAVEMLWKAQAIDGFHSIFSLWQLDGITSPCCLLIASHDLLPSSFYGERCYEIHLLVQGHILETM